MKLVSGSLFSSHHVPISQLPAQSLTTGWPPTRPWCQGAIPPPTEFSNPLCPGRTAGSEFKILPPSSCPCPSGESLKKPKQKNQACDSFVRTTHQNKIPVYCWTTLFHTYIKQAKKNKQQLHRQKRKKKETFYLWPF